MVGKKHNLVGHVTLPRVFSVGQNVRCVFRLVGQTLILVGHCPMSDRYFKACSSSIVVFMIIYVKLKRDILGVILRSEDLYTYTSIHIT